MGTLVDFIVFSTPHHETTARYWRQILMEHGVFSVLQLVDEPLSPKAIRLQQQPALWVDAQGVWLLANGLKMQPDWQSQIYRLLRAGQKSELLARACALQAGMQVVDATAGLGHDALLLAWLGANVTLLERHPVMYVLLSSTLMATQQYAAEKGYGLLAQALSRMHLEHASAVQWLNNHVGHGIDVVYLDPMFPHSTAPKGQPKVKKEMQILHVLLANDTDQGDDLLLPACQVAPRVVVKRPKLAPPLAETTADHAWKGDACRFDVYFKQAHTAQHLVSNTL